MCLFKFLSISVSPPQDEEPVICSRSNNVFRSDLPFFVLKRSLVSQLRREHAVTITSHTTEAFGTPLFQQMFRISDDRDMLNISSVLVQSPSFCVLWTVKPDSLSVSRKQFPKKLSRCSGSEPWSTTCGVIQGAGLNLISRHWLYTKSWNFWAHPIGSIGNSTFWRSPGWSANPRISRDHWLKWLHVDRTYLDSLF